MKNVTYIRAGLLSAIALAVIVMFWPTLAHIFNGPFEKNTDDIPVLIADHFIPPFQVLKPEDVKIKYFPKEFVPPGVLHSSNEMLKEDGQLVYSTIVGIPEGQPLTRTVLNETGKEHGMSSLLRPGKVAVSFKVEREKSAGGWVHPGDTIAIFQKVRMDFGQRAERRQTRLLLSAVEVLAVNQAHLGHEPEVEPASEGPLQTALQDNEAQVLTVLANTADASALIEAQEAGPLTIVLRPLGDDLPWLPGRSDIP